ncbi:MAG: prepilin-type N-terminal cleavage/methylation domain-containing protein [Phycisphaerae bacterium]|nr:prepilin-type N-terminal cleavage/methylation domain-containing protein [Phycisphaerae bacterium]
MREKTTRKDVRQIELPEVKQGFTLIELLVVIAILSLLVSILVPSLTKARELAKMVVCETQLRNIGYALGFYADDNGEYLPSGRVRRNKGYFWWCLLYPYLDSRDYGDNHWPDLEVFLCPTQEAHYTPGSIWSHCDYADSYWFGYDRAPNSAPAPEYDPAQAKISQVLHPADTAYAVDSKSGVLGGPYVYGATDPRADFRHLDGVTANLLFVDGHVENLDYSEAADVDFGEDNIQR